MSCDKSRDMSCDSHMISRVIGVIVSISNTASIINLALPKSDNNNNNNKSCDNHVIVM